MNSLVTIALPTYQRAPQLRRAIESVLAQDYAPIELIISDNASTDGTREMCERYAAQHSSIRYVRRPVNVGPTLNFEMLRPMARGDYFLFLGDDDWIDHRYVSTCLATIQANSGSSLVAGLSVYHHAGRVRAEPNPFNVEEADPRRRVLAFCRKVRANGVFYGLIPVAVDRRIPALRNVMGGDMMHVMALCYLGTVRTREDVSVHRAVDGSSISLASVASSLGLGWFSATAPQVAIAYWIFRDIAIDSPLYAELGRWRRLWLAMRAGGIVFFRFVPPAAVKFARLQASALGHQLGLRAAGARKP